MKKGFTLSEVLVTIAILGIIAVLIVPQLVAKKPNKAKLLFKKGYNVTSNVVSALQSDIYEADENGDVLFSKGSSDTYFCEEFAKFVNHVGDVTCNNSTDSLAFVTSDGLKYSINGARNKFTGDGAEVILNVNPDASKVGATGTHGVDYFIIYVKDDGKIYVNGEKEEEYIKDCEGSECETPSTPGTDPTDPPGSDSGDGDDDSTCPEGQIPDGDTCCADTNPANGTCDEDETPTCTNGKVLVNGVCTCPSGTIADGDGCCADTNPANGTCDEDETPTCTNGKVLVNGVCTCPSGTIENGYTCCDDTHPEDGKCDNSVACSDLGSDIDNGNCAYICQYYPDEGVCPEYCETYSCGGSIADSEYCDVTSHLGVCQASCLSNPCQDWCYDLTSGTGYDPNDYDFEAICDMDGDGCKNDIDYVNVSSDLGYTNCVARSKICSVIGDSNGNATTNELCSNSTDDSFICDDSYCECYVYPNNPDKPGYYCN